MKYFIKTAGKVKAVKLVERKIFELGKRLEALKSLESAGKLDATGKKLLESTKRQMTMHKVHLKTTGYLPSGSNAIYKTADKTAIIRSQITNLRRQNLIKPNENTLKKLTELKRELAMLTKHAGLTDMIQNEAWLDNPIYKNEASDMLIKTLKDIEARRPLRPGQNPDTTTNEIL